MAPIRKRASLRARASVASKPSPSTSTAEPHLPLPEDYLPPSATTTDTSAFDAWSLSKKDKRTMKHGLLLQKVRQAGISKDSKTTKPLRRRRPGKKLKTDLAGLGDALPAVEGAGEGEEEGDEEWEGIDDDDHGTGGITPLGTARRRRRRVAAQRQTLVMKSLTHRPGAMKRKRKMETREMERFGRNLAQLVGSAAPVNQTAAEPAGVSLGDKWAALRKFIGGTMEQSKAFEKR